MTFADLAGTRWSGQATLYFPTEDDANPSAATIAIEPGELTYTWSLEGKDNVGRITLTDGGATFEDSWHQAKPMACSPLDSPALLDVHYVYHQGWSWRITLVRRESGELVLRMTNITPWGEHQRAHRFVCTRA